MPEGAIGTALVLLPAVTGLFAAAALRVGGPVGRLLAAYVVGWACILGPELVLSPFRRLTGGWMVTAELVLALAAAGAWLARGRRRLVPALALRRLRLDWSVSVLVAAVGIAGIYDLALVVHFAPNTYDSLTYHLPRAAQWLDHGGWYWIENAATARLNVFPPGAELGILYTVLAFGSDRLVELPQLLGEAATLLAVYGLARRVGFGREEALFAALLLATFSVVALEATTSQNDLVMTSFGVAAAYFVLGERRAEAALAALAVALALATKTTVALVLPAVVMLAVAVDTRRRLVELAGLTALFTVLFAVPAYARNIEQTGSLLSGDGVDEHRAELTFGGFAATAVRVSYRFLDLSGYRHVGTVEVLLLAAGIGLIVLGFAGYARRPRMEWAFAGLVLGAPFVLSLASEPVRAVADLVGLDVNPSGATVTWFDWKVNDRADEDISYFGPLGATVLLAATIVALRQARGGRWWTVRLALALSIPTAVVLVAIEYKYNDWLGRFMIAPVALTAPLLASLHRHRAVALAAAALGSVTLAVAVLYSVQKPSGLGPADSGWTRTRMETLTQERGRAARAFASYDALVPSDACVGALFGNNDIVFPLYDPGWRRKVEYLPPSHTALVADAERLDWVVVSPNALGASAPLLASGRWKAHQLEDYLLVLERLQGRGACHS